MKTFVLAAAVAVAASGLVPGVAQAQSGPNIIEVRQVGMALLAGDFAGIRAVAAAKGDVKTLENPAKAIGRFAAIMPSLFPQGTAAGNNTKALPEVFSDAAGFKKAADAMGEASAMLVKAAAAGDAAGVDAAIKAMGDSCGGCHRGYRAR